MPAVGNVITGNGTVPSGGTTNQVLSKIDGTNYNIQWATPAGGGNVSNSGTPTVDQLGVWVTATTIKGVTTLPSVNFPALTGDVTTVATSLVTTIGANKVGLSQMATIATDSILGRATAATGNVEVLTALPWAYTGDVTRAADSNATVLAAGNAGNLNSGTLLAARMPALTGDVTTTAGAVATTIANNAVTYAKMQDVTATSRFLGRITAGAGDPEELTAANAKTILALTATDVGLGSVTNDAQAKASIHPNTLPAAGQILVGNAGATAYAPVTLTGATLSSAGALSAIPNASLSNSAITIATVSTSLGGSITQDQITGLSATGIIKRTAANTLVATIAKTDYWDTTNFVQSGASAAKGLVPAPSTTAGTAAFLCEDATWKVPAGAGNVSNSGTPTSGQSAQWVSSTAIKGVTYASSQSSLLNPSTTTNLTGVMCGMSQVITPSATGKVLASFSGALSNDTAGAAGSQVVIRYAQAASGPANGAALTGTVVGGVGAIGIAANPANCRFPLGLTAVVTGLTVGLPYWFDLSQASITAGTTTVRNVAVTLAEIP